VIAPEGAAPAVGEFIEVAEAEPLKGEGRLASPLYFLLVASRSRAPIERIPPPVSVLSDRDEWSRKDYEKVMRDLEGTAKERDYAEKLVHERDNSIDFMTRDFEAWKRQKAGRRRALRAGARRIRAHAPPSATSASRRASRSSTSRRGDRTPPVGALVAQAALHPPAFAAQERRMKPQMNADERR
jgi:hypothetical protein